MAFWSLFGSLWDPLGRPWAPFGFPVARLGAPWQLWGLCGRAWVPTLMVLVTLRCSWLLLWCPCMALGLEIHVFALLWRSLGSVFLHFEMIVGCLRLVS